MKKLIILLALLIIPAITFAEVDRNCYQNFTAIRCGDQQILLKPDFCGSINLTISSCIVENSTISFTFSGMDYFEMPSDIYYITLNMYSRDWTFAGNKNTPLPENSTISIAENGFAFSAPTSRKIEAVQLTVPYCYSQIDSDREKIYPTTQAGGKCIIGKNEISQTEIVIPEKTAQNTGKEGHPEESAGGLNRDWLLAILMVVVIAIGIIALKPRGGKRKNELQA